MADVTMERMIAFWLHPFAIELGGQPVEQLRVRWRRALRAEILAGLDDAAAEELLPQPIDGHARDERVVFVDQPSRQSQPVRRLVVTHGCSAFGVPA